ncbi:trigger factor [Fusibacter sp. JL216-2]|uniref:trigger factor n=1 Tax=Fusibacter sp. JL216-2 TaxID=3071453 RepID=UPI003D340BE3
MSYELLKTEKNVATINITVPAKDFEEAVQKTYMKERGRFNLQGFRKGKAPRKIIEMNYGEGVFFDGALEVVLQPAYSEAIDGLEIEPVARPDIDIKEIGKGKDLVIEAVVAVKPEVTLGDYTGLEVEKVSAEISDEDLEMELKKQQEMNGRLVSVEDRAIENGDTAIIDFEGFVDGVAFEGGKGENHNLEIGSGSFIPGFEEQLIGKNVGEDVDVNVTFPDQYQSDELAGKDAVFKVAVKGIKVKELPELDDEFAKDTSEFDTLEELKADIKAKMEESAKSQSEAATRDRVIDAVVANMTAEIPDQMVESEIDGMLQDFEYQLRYQGLDLEKYLQFSGTTMQEMREQMQDDALTRVKTSLTLETISKKENIEVTEEDLEKEFERLAEMQGQSVDEIKKMLGSQTDYMKASIETRKTVDFLVENAKLV